MASPRLSFISWGRFSGGTSGFSKRNPSAPITRILTENDWILIRSPGQGRPGQSRGAGREARGPRYHGPTGVSALWSKEATSRSAGCQTHCLLDHSANAYITLDVESKKVPDVCASLMTAARGSLFHDPDQPYWRQLPASTQKTPRRFTSSSKSGFPPQKGLLSMETHMRAAIKKTYYGFLVGRNNH